MIKRVDRQARCAVHEVERCSRAASLGLRGLLCDLGGGRLAAVGALLAAVTALCWSAPAGAAVSFVQATGSPFALTRPPAGLVASDLDGNGRLDVAATAPAAISARLGNGDGSFQAAQESASQSGNLAQRPSSSDFNRDGHLDLVTGNSSVGKDYVVVSLGQGDGTFVKGPGGLTVDQVPELPEQIATGDFNGDGDADVISAGQYGTVSLLLGNGDGSLQASRDVSVGGSADSVVAADLNGDGKLDAAVGTDQGVAILLGNGDGTFQSERVVTVGQVVGSLGVGDLNGDGSLDLVLGEPDAGQVGAMLGDGQGAFTLVGQTTEAGQFPRVGSPTDITGDGRLDVVASSYQDGKVSVLVGEGNGTFGPAQTFAVDGSPNDLAIGDFDGNDQPDIATANSSSPGSVSVLLNRSTPTPLGPTAATGSASADSDTASATLQGTVSGHDTDTTYHFEYGPSTAYGSQTPAGTVPASRGDDLVAVSAQVQGLAPGTYHYRLVATSSTGTAQGADQTVTVPAPAGGSAAGGPPTAQTLPNPTVTPTTATVSGSVDPDGAATTSFFEYGTTTAYGARSSSVAIPADAAARTVSAQLAGLAASTRYHFRIVASNGHGTAAGADQTFLTSAPAAFGATAALTAGQRTSQQRDFTLAVSCDARCSVRLDHLELRYAATNDAGILSRYEHDPGYRATHDPYGQVAAYPLDGQAVSLAAGTRAVLHGSIPLEAQGPVSEVLNHGGAVRMTVSAAAQGDEQSAPYVSTDTKVLVGQDVQAAQASRAPASGAATSDLVTVTPLQLVGRFAAYEVQIDGHQLTQWSYDSQSTDANGCHDYSRGDGRQTIEFSSTPTRGLVGAFHLDGPVADGRAVVLGGLAMFTADGHAPLQLPAGLDVTRHGSSSEGATGNCNGSAGGTGTSPQRSDCGSRVLSGELQFTLRPEAFLTGTQWDSYTQRVPLDAQSYANCPFQGFSRYVSGLELLPTLDKHLRAQDLSAKNGPAVGKSVSFTAHDSLTTAIDGGASVTTISWKVKLTRIATVICKRAGTETVCVDEQQKKQAQKDALHYQQEIKTWQDIKSAECTYRFLAPPGSTAAQAHNAACTEMTAMIAYNLLMFERVAALANDPPQTGYRHVARPHPARLPKVPHRLAAYRRLRANQARTAGLMDAVFTTMDRASGAHLAGAGDALRRQNQAALRDARQAAALLGQQPTLLRRAAQEIRHLLPKAKRPIMPASATRQAIQSARAMQRLMRSFAHQRIRQAKQKRPKKHMGAPPGRGGHRHRQKST